MDRFCKAMARPAGYKVSDKIVMSHLFFLVIRNWNRSFGWTKFQQGIVFFFFKSASKSKKWFMRPSQMWHPPFQCIWFDYWQQGSKHLWISRAAEAAQTTSCPTASCRCHFQRAANVQNPLIYLQVPCQLSFLTFLFLVGLQSYLRVIAFVSLQSDKRDRGQNFKILFLWQNYTCVLADSKRTQQKFHLLWKNILSCFLKIWCECAFSWRAESFFFFFFGRLQSRNSRRSHVSRGLKCVFTWRTE